MTEQEKIDRLVVRYANFRVSLALKDRTPEKLEEERQKVVEAYSWFPETRLCLGTKFRHEP